MSKFGSVVRRISSTAFFITVRLRRPKKSILSRPIFSAQTISYCVLTPVSLLASGAYSTSGPGEMTTPAACVPALRASPSIAFAVSSSRRISGDAEYSTFRSVICSSASPMDMPPGPEGIIFATRSTSGSGTPKARPASRTAARAAIVPNVTICATRSSPYFSVTYLMTSSRRSTQKSVSISGIEIRSGFRNRSKMRLYLSGSKSVIFKQYEITEPTAEPRPGPTGISRSFAYLMKSQTIRKYDANPILRMTSSSYSKRSRSAASLFARSSP